MLGKAGASAAAAAAVTAAVAPASSWQGLVSRERKRIRWWTAPEGPAPRQRCKDRGVKAEV